MRKLLFLLIGTFIMSSCSKDLTPEEQLQKDLDLIKQYLADNNLTASSTSSGLHYIITKQGTGGSPDINSTVTVKYKGYLLDGSVFDETNGSSTATFPLSNLIEGWQEGIPLLNTGGKGTFLIPSYLGYGRSQIGTIPANSVLIFEIELVKFQ
jgi:FKBP-type peptidyl-prolyl cis-trans isomerase FkpA